MVLYQLPFQVDHYVWVNCNHYDSKRHKARITEVAEKNGVFCYKVTYVEYTAEWDEWLEPYQSCRKFYGYDNITKKHFKHDLTDFLAVEDRNKYRIDQTVWMTWHDGKNYEGKVVAIRDKPRDKPVRLKILFEGWSSRSAEWINSYEAQFILRPRVDRTLRSSSANPPSIRKERTARAIRNAALSRPTLPSTAAIGRRRQKHAADTHDDVADQAIVDGGLSTSRDNSAPPIATNGLRDRTLSSGRMPDQVLVERSSSLTPSTVRKMDNDGFAIPDLPRRIGRSPSVASTSSREDSILRDDSPTSRASTPGARMDRSGSIFSSNQTPPPSSPMPLRSCLASTSRESTPRPTSLQHSLLTSSPTSSASTSLLLIKRVHTGKETAAPTTKKLKQIESAGEASDAGTSTNSPMRTRAAARMEATNGYNMLAASNPTTIPPSVKQSHSNRKVMFVENKETEVSPHADLLTAQSAVLDEAMDEVVDGVDAAVTADVASSSAARAVATVSFSSHAHPSSSSSATSASARLWQARTRRILASLPPVALDSPRMRFFRDHVTENMQRLHLLTTGGHHYKMLSIDTCALARAIWACADINRIICPESDLTIGQLRPLFPGNDVTYLIISRYLQLLFRAHTKAQFRCSQMEPDLIETLLDGDPDEAIDQMKQMQARGTTRIVLAPLHCSSEEGNRYWALVVFDFVLKRIELIDTKSTNAVGEVLRALAISLGMEYLHRFYVSPRVEDADSGIVLLLRCMRLVMDTSQTSVEGDRIYMRMRMITQLIQNDYEAH